MWNYSSPPVDDVNPSYPDDTEVSTNVTASRDAQHHCTTTLSFAINTVGAGLVCLFGLIVQYHATRSAATGKHVSEMTHLLSGGT